MIRQMAMLGERRVTTVDFALEQLLASVDKHVTSKITWIPAITLPQTVQGGLGMTFCERAPGHPH